MRLVAEVLGVKLKEKAALKLKLLSYYEFSLQWVKDKILSIFSALK